MYTTDPGTQDGVSIWHRRQSLARKGPVDATASNLDTLLDRGFGRRVRMLLSFQRPSHLFGRGFLPRAHPRPFRSRSGPVSIAPGPPHGEGAYSGWPGSLLPAAAPLGRPCAPSDGCSCVGQRSGVPEPAIAGATGGRAAGRLHRDRRASAGPPGEAGPAAARASAYDSTWTVTVRRRGRSSKSISTTCCQVPSASRPSTTGIVSEGPISGGAEVGVGVGVVVEAVVLVVAGARDQAVEQRLEVVDSAGLVLHRGDGDGRPGGEHRSRRRDRRRRSGGRWRRPA